MNHNNFNFLVGMLVGALITTLSWEMYNIVYPQTNVITTTKEVSIIAEEKKCKDANGRFSVRQSVMDDNEVRYSCYSKSETLFGNEQN